MTIASILREKGNAVTTVTGDLTIHDVVSLLHEHRIGALIVVDADRIYVLDNGAVTQAGTHAALMAADGLYANLYRHNLEDAR